MNKFKKLFKQPEIILSTSNNGFSGTISLEFKTEWFIKYKWKKLLKTGKAIVEEVVFPKKNEIFGVGFELIPPKKCNNLP